jgi:hypothetical protein
MFKGDEDEDPELMADAEEHFFMPRLLRSTSDSILKYLSSKTISPILTDTKFNRLLEERHGLNPLEKRLVERDLFKTDRLKYSRAEIDQGRKREFRIMIVGERASKLKLTKQHLMMFELDTNKDELKSGLVRVEGRKDFLENEIKQLVKFPES